MKKMMTFLKKAEVKAFTLVEMLVVLLIISVLLLLFVPNLTKQKEAVNDKGKAAVVKVVESQAELYSLDKNQNNPLSLELLDYEPLLHHNYLMQLPV